MLQMTLQPSKYMQRKILAAAVRGASGTCESRWVSLQCGVTPNNALTFAHLPNYYAGAEL